MTAMKPSEQNYEVILCEYAAGTLDIQRSLIVATHVSMNDLAQETLAEYEGIGGVLLEECNCADVSAACLEKVLMQLDDAQQSNSAPVVAKDIEHELGFDLPLPLQSYVLEEAEIPLRWKKSMPSGMMTCELNVTNIDRADNKARLIKMEPGVSVPAHGHGGQELTLILDGAMSDEYGSYKTGDLIVLDEHFEHTPTADPKLGCICLAVSCAPIKLKGWASVLNPFLSK